MPSFVKNVSNLSKTLQNRAKMLADFSSNPKSVYAHMHPSEQAEHVNQVLRKMSSNPDIDFNEQEFLDQMRKRMYAEGEYQKTTGMSLNDVAPEDPKLHDINYDLEQQADDFLRENDPEFFEELEQAMKGYDENIESVSEYSKIPALMEQELKQGSYIQPDNTKNLDKALLQYQLDYIMNDPTTRSHVTSIIKDPNANPLDPNNYEYIFNKPARLSALEEQIKYNLENKGKKFNNNPKENPLTYHLSKDPLENASEIEFPETTFNKRYHNVPVPSGKFNYVGQHKPADYYHNILWNYINKGSNRDEMLEEFFQDILHKPTPTNAQEKYQTINKYKNALDKRRLELDMKNKPYNKDKLTNMQAIEEYFDKLRPSSFEDFESSTLSKSPNPNFDEWYYNFVRDK